MTTRIIVVTLGMMQIKKARKEANTDRVQLIQDLMQYTLKEWANNNQVIEPEIDKFIATGMKHNKMAEALLDKR